MSIKVIDCLFFVSHSQVIIRANDDEPCMVGSGCSVLTQRMLTNTINGVHYKPPECLDELGDRKNGRNKSDGHSTNALWDPNDYFAYRDKFMSMLEQ